MAVHKYRLEQQAIDAGATFLAEHPDVEVGAEFKHDFDLDTTRAVVAAGWVTPLDTDDASAKGGKK